MAKKKTSKLQNPENLPDWEEVFDLMPLEEDKTEILPFLPDQPDHEITEDELEHQEGWRQMLMTFGAVITPSFKESLTMMSHPLFAFRPKKDSLPRVIDCGNYTITLTPSQYGLPTYNDADILIYAMSQIASEMKDKKQRVKPEMMRYHSDIVFAVSDYFKALKKSYGGKQQQAFMQALQRLTNTNITITAERMVNGKMVKFEQTASGFLTNSMSLSTMTDKNQPLSMVRLRLADWIVRDITSFNVLTIPTEYFDLNPFAKALFLVARRHLGLPNPNNPDLTKADLAIEEKIAKSELPIRLPSGRKMDMFYWKTSLKELSVMVGNTRQLRNFKQDILRTMAEINFDHFELAITDTRRLNDTEVVFFRKDRLGANIAQATILYSGFKEFYDQLITTDMVKPKKKDEKAKATTDTGIDKA